MSSLARLLDEARAEERISWTEEGEVGTVIEVKANGLVGSGEFKTPRHPQYLHVRVDKDAKDCTMEQFK